MGHQVINHEPNPVEETRGGDSDIVEAKLSTTLSKNREDGM
jgi:hypothetical protein